MGMASHYRIRSCINHQFGQALLASGGIRLILYTPMHERNHHIRLVYGSGVPNIGHHLLIVAPCRARPINIGFKASWEKFVVAQNSDGETLAFEQHGLVRLLQITSSAKKRHLGFV